MIGPQPGAVARCLLWMTVAALPADARDRYREEFRTELCEYGPIAQIAQAASLLRGSIPLRQALKLRVVIPDDTPRIDWRCRVVATTSPSEPTTTQRCGARPIWNAPDAASARTARR